MTLLTYDSKYVISSAVGVTTESTSLVDDTQASQTFNLTASKTVLVIYAAHNVFGTESYAGKRIAISVDGTDYGLAGNSPYGGGHCNGVTTFWIGTLVAGSHTIKGRFRCIVTGGIVTISERVLLIMVFNGDEFQYMDNATLAQTNSSTFVNDTPASITFTPSGNAKALILYNTSSLGNTETKTGKKIAINFSAVDYSQSETSPYGGGYDDNVTTLHYSAVTPTSYTVKGRFARLAVVTVSIARRQFGVLLFADTALADYITSDTEVNTASPYPVDDTQATINRTTTDSRQLLVVAMGTKRNDVDGTYYGEAYGIKIDANDRAKSRNSPYGEFYANSNSTAYAEELAAGSHTVQGRFGQNPPSIETVRISSRRVVALWFVTANILEMTMSGGGIGGGAFPYTRTKTLDMIGGSVGGGSFVYNRVKVFDMVGGGLGGGAFIFNLGKEVDMIGGGLGGGSFIFNLGKEVDMVGGGLGGGSFDYLRTKVFDMFGGGLGGGESLYLRTKVLDMIGGGIGGGAFDYNRVKVFDMIGGGLGGGSFIFNLGKEVDMIGGGIGGGAFDYNRIIVLIMLGGGLGGGSADVEFIIVPIGGSYLLTLLGVQ